MAASPWKTSSTVWRNRGAEAPGSYSQATVRVIRAAGSGGNSRPVRRSTIPLAAPSRCEHLSSSATGTTTRGSDAARVTMCLTICARWDRAQNAKKRARSSSLSMSLISSTRERIVSLA